MFVEAIRNKENIDICFRFYGDKNMSLKNKLANFGGKIMDRINQNEEILNKVSDVKEKISKIGSSFDKVKTITAEKLGDTFDFSLPVLFSSKEYYLSALEYISSKYHIHSENPAIREVIDGLAHLKGYGGGQFHRIADGRHSIPGAFKAVNENLPDLELSEKIKGTFSHLWSDFHSSKGISLVSFDGLESFDKFCNTLGLNNKLINDLFSVNSSEAIGSALSIIPVIFKMNEMEASDFAKAAGRLGILTAIGEGQFEAVSGIFTLILLGRSFYLSNIEDTSTSKILTDCWVEGGFTAVSLGLTQLLPLPINIVIPLLIVGLKNKVHEHGLRDGIEIYNENLLDQLTSIKSSLNNLELSAYREKIFDWAKELDSSDLKEMLSEYCEKANISSLISKLPNIK